MNKMMFGRNIREYNDNLLILYDCKTGEFTYPTDASGYMGACFDERPLWQIALEDGFCDAKTAQDLQDKILEVAASKTPQAYYAEYCTQGKAAEGKWYRIGFICSAPETTVMITITDIDAEIVLYRQMKHAAECDELTGLLNRSTFCKKVNAVNERVSDAVAAGEYAMFFLDILRFKAINDMFGMTTGDQVLIHIANVLTRYVKPEDEVCRLGSDQFAVYTHTSGSELEKLVQTILDEIQAYELPIELTCNIGVYVTDDQQLEAQLMIDRATIAQASVKENYNIRICYYTESLRMDLIGEQEIVGTMAAALADNQFVVYYQPQYNHTTGALIGAEALVRWQHPEVGLISPGIFIPIFEKNGFITRLDMFVFEQCCRFLRDCMDQGTPMVPISANFSRRDIFQSDFVEHLERIREKYEVPARYLRVEITESVVVGGSRFVNEIVQKLHQYGYIVEMDDFGSGYSSLNVLKDLDLDIIKLDMLFLSKENKNNRGGTILSSIVRMAKWLNMPVIAEGVETIEQADFLRSIGCDNIQGYLYSRPIPEAEYKNLLGRDLTGEVHSQAALIDTMNGVDFWNPQSQETLIFSNYVGGAAIFEYHDSQVEVLRVNQKYLQELCMNLTEKEVIQFEFLKVFDETNKNVYLSMLEKAVETNVSVSAVMFG